MNGAEFNDVMPWGPDGQLTDVQYDEKVFFPVMDDGSDYVW